MKSTGGSNFYINHISSRNDSNTETLTFKIEYDNDETLEIKEEICPDDTCQKCNKKYESKLSTVSIEEDILPISNQKKQKIQESRWEPEQKYKCEKCARTYKKKSYLTFHQKYECDVMPQFRCKFCGKLFTRKNNMSRHVDIVHNVHDAKTRSKTSEKRHKCGTCSRSYSWIQHLYRHKRLEHAAVKPQFTCDICGYIAKAKYVLSRHISSHLHRKK